MVPKEKNNDAQKAQPQGGTAKEGNIIKEALEFEATVKLKPEKTISNDELEQIVDQVSKECGTKSKAHAMVGIFATLQAGGTSNNKRSNVKITIGDVTFESKIINGIITKTCKGVTPRQFARFYANEIFEISKRHGITGNAYVYISRFHSNLLTEEGIAEKFWCSDFQVDNTNCPEYIRKALMQRYTDKFRVNKSK